MPKAPVQDRSLSLALMGAHPEWAAELAKAQDAGQDAKVQELLMQKAAKPAAPSAPVTKPAVQDRSISIALASNPNPEWAADLAKAHDPKVCMPQDAGEQHRACSRGNA